MRNGWTGGQYSVYRALLGMYLTVHFLHLLPWSAEIFSSSGMIAQGAASPLFGLLPNVLQISDAPLAVALLIALGAYAALLLTLGWHDKAAAIVAWYVLACLFARNPLIANPGLPYVGWMLLAHLVVPSGPIGSLEGARRPHKPFEWSMPPQVFLAAWAILALSYSYSGYTKLLSPSWVSGETVSLVLQNPLARDHFLRSMMLSLPEEILRGVTWFILVVELLFAPLALVRMLRPMLWGLMLFVQFGFLFLLNFADLTTPMILFHFLTFDPAWLKGPRPANDERLFYDGVCGFCHRVVAFSLSEDRSARLRFGPLQGSEFVAAIPNAVRSRLPDSIVLVDENGRLLLKSDAVLHVMRRLGGLWWPVAVVLERVPTRLRNACYDGVGRVRRRLFPQPTSLCPMVPPSLRTRFVN